MVYEIARNSEFNINPGMVGHRIAKETFEYAMSIYDSYATDDARKIFFESVVEDSNDWHYWCAVISKKYISNVRYVLRRIGKMPFLALLSYHNEHSSILKDELTWSLEILTYMNEKKWYQDDYALSYEIYGLKRDEALERLDRYIEGLIEKNERMSNMVDRLLELGEKEGVSNES